MKIILKILGIAIPLVCKVCGEEHTEKEMIGEVCISCASVMQDIDFEC